MNLKDDIYAILLIQHIHGNIDISEYVVKIPLYNDQLLDDTTLIKLGYNMQYYTSFPGIIIKGFYSYFINTDTEYIKIIELYNKIKNEKTYT